MSLFEKIALFHTTRANGTLLWTSNSRIQENMIQIISICRILHLNTKINVLLHCIVLIFYKEILCLFCLVRPYTCFSGLDGDTLSSNWITLDTVINKHREKDYDKITVSILVWVFWLYFRMLTRFIIINCALFPNAFFVYKCWIDTMMANTWQRLSKFFLGKLGQHIQAQPA